MLTSRTAFTIDKDNCDGIAEIINTLFADHALCTNTGCGGSVFKGKAVVDGNTFCLVDKYTGEKGVWNFGERIDIIPGESFGFWDPAGTTFTIIPNEGEADLKLRLRRHERMISNLKKAQEKANANAEEEEKKFIDRLVKIISLDPDLILDGMTKKGEACVGGLEEVQYRVVEKDGDVKIVYRVPEWRKSYDTLSDLARDILSDAEEEYEDIDEEEEEDCDYDGECYDDADEEDEEDY